VQALTAPMAVIVDVVSFLVSGTFLKSIRVAESPAVRPERRAGLGDEITEGLRFVLQ
jgi:hypothetical protein